MGFIMTNRDQIIELILWVWSEGNNNILSVEDAESMLEEFNNLKP